MEPRIQYAKTKDESVHSGPGAYPATPDIRYRLTFQVSLNKDVGPASCHIWADIRYIRPREEGPNGSTVRLSVLLA